MRVGVSSRIAKIALSNFYKKDINEIEELWHAFDPPYRELIEWLHGITKKPNVNDRPVFRSPMLANPLEEIDYKIINPNNYLAEWKWDGIRIQLVSLNQTV